MVGAGDEWDAASGSRTDTGSRSAGGIQRAWTCLETTGLLDAFPAGLWIFDGPDHRIVTANRVARAMAGDRVELVGRPAREVVPEVLGQEIYECLREVGDTGLPSYGRQWRLWVNRDGDLRSQELHLSVSIVPWRGEGGGPQGLLLHTVDITGTASGRETTDADVVSRFQRDLLSLAVPVVPGLRLSAHYRVAGDTEGAGGDWFDALPLGKDGLALVVGDVVGRGTSAAAVMGQLRAVLMELLLNGSGIAEALARLDRFAERIPGGRGATVGLGVLDRAGGVLSYASCAHPPPVLINRDGSRVLPAPPGGALGIGGRSPQVKRFPVSPGDVLLMYSDGLIERPGAGLTDGIDALRGAAAAAFADLTTEVLTSPVPDRLCQVVLERLNRGSAADDMTILAAELTPIAPPLDIEVVADASTLGDVRKRLHAWLSEITAGRADADAVVLAVDEAMTNSIEHSQPTGRTDLVRVQASLDDTGRVCVTVTDRGRWRSPRPDSGRRGHGFRIMRGCMDSVEVDHTGYGTLVLMERSVSRPVVFLDARPVSSPPRPGQPADLVVEATGGTRPVLTFRGPVDIRTVALFSKALRGATRGGVLDVTVDLTQVTLLASVGIHALYALAEDGGLGRRSRLIAPPSSPARQVLDLVGLGDIVPVHAARQARHTAD